MKEKLFKKGIKKRLFSVVLALAMIFSLMPLSSMTVYAGTGSTDYTTLGSVIDGEDTGNVCFSFSSEWNQKNDSSCTHEDYITWALTKNDWSRDTAIANLRWNSNSSVLTFKIAGETYNRTLFIGNTHTAWESDPTICELCGKTIPHDHINHYGVTKTNTDNDTLTWYCEDGDCPTGISSANPVSLTLSASDTNYSGSPLEGQITKSAWSTAADVLATASDIYYISQDGTTYPESTTIPAVAGDFYARVYLIDGEGQRIKDSSSNDICAQVAFTIEQWSNPVLVSGVLYKFDVFNVTAYMGEYTCKTHGKVAEPNSGSTVKVGNFDACLAENHFKLNHTHTDHYGVTTTTSTNDTLTWYCSAEECTSGTSSTNPVKLTLTASDENYSGNTATITVGSPTEQTAWTAAGLIVPTAISYEKADKTPLASAPNEAGSYVAKVSPEGVAATAANTARITFTILHDHGEDTSKYAYDGTNHWHPCLRIGCTDEGHKNGIAPHGSWKNGKCETCGYACKHNGATSGICGICKKNLSSSIPAPSKKQAEPAKSPVEEREAVEAIKVVLPVSIDATQFAKVNSTVIPATAYNLSNLITTKGIVRGINTAIAASKLTGSKAVIIYTGKPFCFNREIIKAIQNGNKTVVYYFVHEGQLYSVTVPATVDATKVLERSGFAGPLYVGQQLGTTRLIR